MCTVTCTLVHSPSLAREGDLPAPCLPASAPEIQDRHGLWLRLLNFLSFENPFACKQFAIIWIYYLLIIYYYEII